MVNVRIGSRSIHRVYIDNGSSVNILHYGIYKTMALLGKHMTIGTVHIHGIIGDSVRVKGVVRLPIT